MFIYDVSLVPLVDSAIFYELVFTNHELIIFVYNVSAVDPVLELLDVYHDGFMEEGFVDTIDHLLGGGHHVLVNTGQQNTTFEFCCRVC